MSILWNVFNNISYSLECFFLNPRIPFIYLFSLLQLLKPVEPFCPKVYIMTSSWSAEEMFNEIQGRTPISEWVQSLWTLNTYILSQPAVKIIYKEAHLTSLLKIKTYA